MRDRGKVEDTVGRSGILWDVGNIAMGSPSGRQQRRQGNEDVIYHVCATWPPGCGNYSVLSEVHKCISNYILLGIKSWRI